MGLSRRARTPRRRALRCFSGKGASVDGAVLGAVLAWEAPSVLEYVWQRGPGESWQVRYELAATYDGATLLRSDHLRPDPAGPDVAADDSPLCNVPRVKVVASQLDARDSHGSYLPSTQSHRLH